MYEEDYCISYKCHKYFYTCSNQTIIHDVQAGVNKSDQHLFQYFDIEIFHDICIFSFQDIIY